MNTQGRDVVLCLCDLTGVFARPWVEAGYTAILVDPQHPDGVRRRHDELGGEWITVGHEIDHPDTWRTVRTFLHRIAFVCGYPPCTDVSLSGTRWWASKAAQDRYFQCRATRVAEQCQTIGKMSGAPWFMENPMSAFGKIYGRPCHKFHPWHFSGIELGDNYTKETWLWTGGGFVMPEKDVHPRVQESINVVVADFGRQVPIDKVRKRYGADSEVVAYYPSDRIHKCPPGVDRANIRSATPPAFSTACYRANAATAWAWCEVI